MPESLPRIDTLADEDRQAYLVIVENAVGLARERDASDDEIREAVEHALAEKGQ